MADKRRKYQYISGSAAPQPEREPEQRPVRRAKQKTRELHTYAPAARKARKALAFDLRYTAVLTVVLLVMVISCVVMLIEQEKVSETENKLNSLQTRLESVQADNASFENSLNDKYSLKEIYDIATNKLGMVYSQNGQIVYYDNAEGDYVKQYENVPSSK